MNKQKAWEKFKETGKIEYYLEYKKEKKKWVLLIKKLEGIVISETAYGDSSKIINVLTKEHGIIGIMAKGAKSLKSKLRSGTDRFTFGFFHVYFKENKLSTLSNVDIIDSFKNIKSNIELLSYLNYIVELTTQVVKQNYNELIYENLIKTILKINEGFSPLIMTNILEAKFLDYLGVGLNFDSCVKCGKKSNIVTLDGDAGGYLCKNCLDQQSVLISTKALQLFRMYYYVEIDSISKLDITLSVQNEINHFLDKYYDRYTGLYLNSKSFLKAIVN